MIDAVELSREGTQLRRLRSCCTILCHHWALNRQRTADCYLSSPLFLPSRTVVT